MFIPVRSPLGQAPLSPTSNIRSVRVSHSTQSLSLLTRSLSFNPRSFTASRNSRSISAALPRSTAVNSSGVALRTAGTQRVPVRLHGEVQRVQAIREAIPAADLWIGLDRSQFLHPAQKVVERALVVLAETG